MSQRLTDITTSHRAAHRAEKKRRRILRLHEVLALTKLSKSSLYGAIASGRFPRPVPIVHGGKAVAWDETEVLDHIDGRFAERDEVVAG
jgi:prophage regulatory protein